MTDPSTPSIEPPAPEYEPGKAPPEGEPVPAEFPPLAPPTQPGENTPLIDADGLSQ